MLFTFRRDDEGREAIVVGGITIARTTGGPEGFEWLNSLPGITAEHIYEAAALADEAGFWAARTEDEVTVDVSVAETTSTILSVDNSEDQA